MQSLSEAFSDPEAIPFAIGSAVGIPWALWLIHISGLIRSNAKVKLILIGAHLVFVIASSWSTIIKFDLGLLCGALGTALFISSRLGAK